MIKSNEGSIEIYGDIDGVKADLTMIIINLVEAKVFTLKDIDKLMSLAKKYIEKGNKND